jgi:predicted aldo/keto reductase-like oxidoreductase
MADIPEKKLGFGLMRLPKLEDGSIDVEQTAKMADEFLAAGMTYFDTAYVYDQGASEEAAGKAIVARHPRDSFTLATKLNAMAAKDEADAKRQIDVSLERMGTDHVDFYLLHALSRQNADLYEKYGCWDYLDELKAAGKARHVGFSFHDSAEFLEELLDAHPNVEFVQLQVNYADWNDSIVQSGKNVAVCQKRGLPFVVMEPVRGGALARPPKPLADVFAGVEGDASLPSWAIRFAASQPGVMVVLSGMSNLAQMEDNLSYMTDFKPLDDEEMAVIRRAQDAFATIRQIKCTGCSYCTKGCPQQIPIPLIFTAMNRYLIWDNLADAKDKYQRETTGAGRAKASDCIACGQCESVCPQHLPVIDLLQEVAVTLE